MALGLPPGYRHLFPDGSALFPARPTACCSPSRPRPTCTPRRGTGRVDRLSPARGEPHPSDRDGQPTAEQLSEILSTVPRSPSTRRPPLSLPGDTTLIFSSVTRLSSDTGDIYFAPVGHPSPVCPGEAWRRLHPEYVLPGDVPQNIGEGDTTSPGTSPRTSGKGTRLPRGRPPGSPGDVPVPVSRTVPRPRSTGTKPSAPGRVRDILGTSPGRPTRLADILRGEGFLGNTINKAIRR